MLNVIRTTSFLVGVAAVSHAHAFRIGAAGGSVGVATGHANAADFAGLLGYKVHYTWKNRADLSFSVTHLLLGKVYQFKSGAFFTPAVGYIADAHDAGLGISTAYGFDFFCWKICVYTELQQQLGWGARRQLISGYAFRLGIDYSNQD